MEDEKIKSEEVQRGLLYYVIYFGEKVIFLLVVPVVFFIVVGFWLDNIFHVSPFFVILGVVIGFIGSMLNVLRVMRYE